MVSSIVTSLMRVLAFMRAPLRSCMYAHARRDFLCLFSFAPPSTSRWDFPEARSGNKARKWTPTPPPDIDTSTSTFNRVNQVTWSSRMSGKCQNWSQRTVLHLVLYHLQETLSQPLVEKMTTPVKKKIITNNFVKYSILPIAYSVQ